MYTHVILNKKHQLSFERSHRSLQAHQMYEVALPSFCNKLQYLIYILRLITTLTYLLVSKIAEKITQELTL